LFYLQFLYSQTILRNVKLLENKAFKATCALKLTRCMYYNAIKINVNVYIAKLKQKININFAQNEYNEIDEYDKIIQ